MIKRWLVIGILLLLIGVNTSSSFVMNADEISMSRLDYDGDILYVGGTGPGNYTRIQDAIDNASDGDTVFVYDDSSPYWEHVVIHKSINLIGELRETTVIHGQDAYPVTLTADYCTVSGFTIHNEIII